MFTTSETEFIKSQPLARLATTSPDNLQPDVSPVGFDFDGTYFYVGGLNLLSMLKYRNVRSNPKVSFVIDDLASRDPWTPRGIKIQGTADLVTHDGYIGPNTYIRIEPSRKHSWGIEEPGT